MSLHVVVTGHLLGPPSGANRRLLQLLAHAAPLLAADERITVLHRRDWQPPAAVAAVAWHAVALPAGGALRRALAERRLLPPLLRRLGATVLDHGLLPAPRVPCSLVQTIHDLRDLEPEAARWAPWLLRRCVRTAARRAHTVVVPSAFTRDRLLALAPTARIAIVPNGVAPAPASAPAPHGPLLHVGHLEPRKHLDLLLRALALLPAARRPVLQLVGSDAGAGASLRDLAHQLGIADHVQFRGGVDDGELARCYAAARAVAVPSRHEGFGLCALEALAHGRPVLVAAAGALPEVVGAAGTVLPVDDAAAWARAIDATANDRGDPARCARAAGFGWTAAAATALAIWRQAAAAGPGGRPDGVS